jgi:hypothetical protein
MHHDFLGVNICRNIVFGGAYDSGKETGREKREKERKEA